MIQLQNGRLVLNWQRLGGSEEYPRWTSVESEFKAAMSELRAFAAAEHLGTMEPNQWEVTYVNHLARGRDWQTPQDWPKLLPGVVGTTSLVTAGALESIGSRLHCALPGEAGRLHIELTHGYSGPGDDAIELLVLQLTARGGVDATRDLAAGLALGREAIVRSFTEITGIQARLEIWRQEEQDS